MRRDKGFRRREDPIVQVIVLRRPRRASHAGNRDCAGGTPKRGKAGPSGQRKGNPLTAPVGDDALSHDTSFSDT